MIERRRLLSESALSGPLSEILGSWQGFDSETYIPSEVPQQMQARFRALSSAAKSQARIGLHGMQQAVDSYKQIVYARFTNVEVKDLSISFETVGVTDDTAHKFLFDIFRYHVDCFTQMHNAWVVARNNFDVDAGHRDS